MDIATVEISVCNEYNDLEIEVRKHPDQQFVRLMIFDTNNYRGVDAFLNSGDCHAIITALEAALAALEAKEESNGDDR